MNEADKFHRLGEKPFVNSWTEWGDLEYVMVGSVEKSCYPDPDPFYYYNTIQDEYWKGYIGERPLGYRPSERIKRAREELQNLSDLLKGECITVVDHKQYDQDVRKELQMKRCRVVADEPKNHGDDKRIKKNIIEICRPPEEKFDHLLMTPWFKNQFQFGLACPRDVVITLGNTILEAPTASRVRYFESVYYRKTFQKYWQNDKRIHWKTAPQPTCGDSMYDLHHFDGDYEEVQRKFQSSGYKTATNETEVAFDAADMIRAGKDIFYKKSAGANNLGIEWLRREFPQFRFHMMHLPTDGSPHLDVNLIPMQPPTPGSDGIVLINQLYPPLESEMKIFTDNDWRPYWCPLPAISELSPVACCSSGLNMNLLSLTSKCCVIEECEIPLYHFLEDLSFDVITCPLRALNEFGGGIHCVTWDIRRNDEFKDFFPDQDYESECDIDLNNFFDAKMYKNECPLPVHNNE